MILDFIAIGIIIVCTGVILVIFWRKFPVLASINVHDLPEHQQSKVKSSLMEYRLQRKFFVLSTKLRDWLKPVFMWIHSWLRGRWHKIKELEKQYEKPPTSTEALSGEQRAERVQKVEHLLEEGISKLREQQLAEAEKTFIEIIGLDPRNVEAYKGLGDVYLGMKDYQHAKEVLQHALRLNAEDDDMHARLGRVAQQMGMFEEARSEYLRSVAINSQIADHHVDLAEVYTNLGQMDKALTSYQEAVQLEPNNPRNLDALLEHAIIMKKKTLAQEILKKFEVVNPENQKLTEFQDRIDNIT